MQSVPEYKFMPKQQQQQDWW